MTARLSKKTALRSLLMGALLTGFGFMAGAASTEPSLLEICLL